MGFQFPHIWYIPSLANVFPTWKANPTPKEWRTIHTLLLPYLLATDFNASKATLNLTEPFKLSQARKRRSSSKSLHIVGLLSNVPLRTKIALGATLGLISTKSTIAANLSHSNFQIHIMVVSSQSLLSLFPPFDLSFPFFLPLSLSVSV